jgi:hypothetical protein
MKIEPHKLSADYGQLALHQMADTISKSVKIYRLFCLECNDLSSGVNSCIRASGCVQGPCGRPQNCRYSLLKHTLYRSQAGLLLPAVKTTAIILDDKFYLLHRFTNNLALAASAR